jgi:heme-degrading monooxygenase HmoA
MLVVQNRIQVNAGFEDRFEGGAQGGQREEVPGRLFFARLKADEPGVYINMTVWESRQACQDWRGSDAFKRAHSGVLPEGAVAGRPQLTVAEVAYSEGSLTSDSAWPAGTVDDVGRVNNRPGAELARAHGLTSRQGAIQW